ncbi:MAG: sugar ABC transporter permease [Rhodobacteraceae bacterium]|nr:MAG: sugar ABC transporter permease [Paracoccaceae bacterium]
MNFYAIKAIYIYEMSRFFRTIIGSLISPIISTTLYFIVFGSAIGSRITDIDGVTYGAFIVPGLMMLNMMTSSLNNGAFGIYFPKFSGTIYEILSAPVSSFEIVIGYVGAAATKSILIGVIILATASLFVDLEIKYPVLMILILVMTVVSFSLFGFIIGIWSDSWERLNFIPTLVVTPLVFLGGTFYSIQMLPELWQKITLLNPVLYLVSGFRWSFFGTGDVSIATSLFAIFLFTILCVSVIILIFKTGYKLQT